ncbi:GIY-YIG nuclease family protein [Candidatus Microgenomates bacterium]|nr:GIY-YIG nuclease family protein [Candidatus Microgenomates bacterium]
MKYVYILYSSKSQNFYVGKTDSLKNRVEHHNEGLVPATKPYRPWRCVFYAAFESANLAGDFERYLKSGSGRSFLYKHLVNSVVLKKARGDKSIPKL